MFGLELRDLTKAYGDQLAADHVSLSIPHGAFVCFLGPSGCGKTTVLRMIAGLETPTSGAILLNGKDITGQPANSRQFGMVFQSLALFPHLSVGENIAFALRLRGEDPRRRKARVAELLELVRLPGLQGRAISQLSGGQRQRVAIARALAQEPPVFLLDEPFSALDAKLREEMQGELRALQRRLKITTILVTHDQREAMTMADTIVVMGEGRIQQHGPPVAIYRRPANRFVADFIGASNLLPVEILDGHTVRYGVTALRVGATCGVGGAQATLAIRPEDLILTRAARGEDNEMAGVISLVRDMGAYVEYRIDCQGQDILGVATPRDWIGANPGEIAHVRLPVESCQVLAR
ncbi:ABC transporter ATP-binding protein [Phenylobacterium sp.]|uniref:ABC transporter ATP-binding protein n=1 Tax=Phenylobacterium sp. TaxID=1871053 RepID=UPI002730BE89|nr:ABC transporter ATP-binding protein [Phenylobacterium sp.]MDP1874188.1 ABC transporter ATP-binding protein [Phenylobacterium sp.]